MTARRAVGALGVAAGIIASATSAAAWGATVRLAGDIVVPAGVVHEGSAVAVRGHVRVEGVLRGDAVAVDGDVEVWGRVTGSVQVVQGRVVLGPLARVDGDVRVVFGAVEWFPGARVGGRVLTGLLWSVPPRRPGSGTLAAFVVRAAALWAMAGVTALVAAVAALFPGPVSRIARTLSRSPGASLLAGVLLWVLLPPLGLVLLVSLVGIPLLALLPFALSLLALAGLAGTALLVGSRLAEAFRWRPGPAGSTLVGAAILAALFLLSGPGRLAFLVALTWGMGAVLVHAFPKGPRGDPGTPSST
ncbi:MAG: polymer-forming cytoskeletal protein [Armatimonadota bacterium]|nr:polymer-forming cytoskeletal protein [Armatimonadota bacterium]MDR7436191.1 polymer-forming cytoskeletal protein [Armatimonadota bacterium]MDR7471428.1 polymer-forming cytoskeletal protein [Armatimonadota bacterium]MDR7507203.1 polymer-forming cytoskeletal protein [Armatimonadota bacterium]MDR7509567.1 polymer-forming cytoskeletal protein [Armatimonadota bacterium]